MTTQQREAEMCHGPCAAVPSPLSAPWPLHRAQGSSHTEKSRRVTAHGWVHGGCLIRSEDKLSINCRRQSVRSLLFCPYLLCVTDINSLAHGLNCISENRFFS